MTVDTSNCYHRNLAALTDAQASLAAAIDAIPIPDGVTPVRGRDDSDTFFLPTGDGRGAWFGGSSMPTISAFEAWSGLRGDGRNLILPGVLTGLEPLLILERIPKHSALFVCEPDGLLLKLALILRDYTRFIESGQLVFVLGEEQSLVDNLVSFFEKNTGYELPVHLLPIAQSSPAQAAELQGHVEAAGRSIATIHAREVELVSRRLSAAASAPTEESPRIALVSSDPSDAAIEHARRIERAIISLGWEVELCLFDAPCRCHLSARLKAVDHGRADLVLLVNDDGGLLRSVVPSEISMVLWLSPHAVIQSPQRLAERFSSSTRDRIATSTPDQAATLLEAGVAKGSVIPLDPAADDVVFDPIAQSPHHPACQTTDFVVLCDLPDDRAQSCGVGQASHQALWESLQDVAARRIAEVGDADAGQLLVDAQRLSGTKLKEAKVHDHFVGLIGTSIIPAATARVAARVLATCGCSYELYGHHWPESKDAGERHKGEIPVGAALNAVFQSTSAVLLPSPSAQSIQTALDALFCGAEVICRTGSVPFVESYPSLCDVEPHIHFYRTARELTLIVEKLKEQSERSGSTGARQAVLSKHTTAQRLRSIVKSYATHPTVS